MKTIYLMRHGQAIDPALSAHDKSRELTAIGVAQARQAAKFLQEKQVKLQHIIHSDAVRTTTTAEAFAEVLNLSSLLVAESELYNASIDRWLHIVRALDNHQDQIILVGHNLGITRFACYLTDEDLPDMQTASVCAIQLAIDDWQSVHSGVGHLQWMFNPI